MNYGLEIATTFRLKGSTGLVPTCTAHFNSHDLSVSVHHDVLSSSHSRSFGDGGYRFLI